MTNISLRLWMIECHAMMMMMMMGIDDMGELA